MTARMMQIGAVTIVFYSLSTLSNGILQGINRMNVPVKNAVIALVLHIGVLAALMYGIPSLAAAVMGLAVYGIYYFLMKTIKINAVSTGISIAAGVCVYGILLLVMRGLKENELRSFPMGNLIIKIAKKLHLM